jgi:hypothetical protein
MFDCREENQEIQAHRETRYVDEFYIGCSESAVSPPYWIETDKPHIEEYESEREKQEVIYYP